LDNTEKPVGKKVPNAKSVQANASERRQTGDRKTLEEAIAKRNLRKLEKNNRDKYATTVSQEMDRGSSLIDLYNDKPPDGGRRRLTSVDNVPNDILFGEDDDITMVDESSNRCTICLRSTKKFFCRIHYPFQPFPKYWDYTILFLLLYCMWEVPVRVGLMIDVPVGSGFWIFTLIVDIIFVMDCIFHFRRAQVDKFGYLIEEPKEIAIYYAKHWFTIDLLSSLPIASIYEGAVSGVDMNAFTRIPVILRVFRSMRLMKLARSVRMCGRPQSSEAWEVSR